MCGETVWDWLRKWKLGPWWNWLGVALGWEQGCSTEDQAVWSLKLWWWSHEKLGNTQNWGNSARTCVLLLSFLLPRQQPQCLEVGRDILPFALLSFEVLVIEAISSWSKSEQEPAITSSDLNSDPDPAMPPPTNMGKGSCTLQFLSTWHD